MSALDQNETSDLYDEIQDDGMAMIGTKIQFTMDGETYNGVVNNPASATQMLTGGYQGHSEMVILATRTQFSSPPAQRGEVIITAPPVFDKTQWRRKQVDEYDANHFSITVMRQLGTQ